MLESRMQKLVEFVVAECFCVERGFGRSLIRCGYNKETFRREHAFDFIEQALKAGWFFDRIKAHDGIECLVAGYRNVQSRTRKELKVVAFVPACCLLNHCFVRIESDD